MEILIIFFMIITIKAVLIMIKRTCTCTCMHVGDSSSETGAYSPFFTTTDLKSGARMAQKFPPDLGATASYFLPKDEADSIPFSLKKLPEILGIFSLPSGSRQAKDVEDSLRLCEGRPIEGETKFCATSVESLTNLVHRFFGTSETGHRGLSLLASTFLDRPKIAFQNFTVLGAPEVVAATKMMGCHVMVYPYAVFYCHQQGGRDRVFKVLLRGDNGDKVKAVAACHDIISKWDPNLAEFRKVRLPERPLCHFFPPHGNLVWVYSNKSASA